jgi:branched-chain amino acid transport system permease protein
MAIGLLFPLGGMASGRLLDVLTLGLTYAMAAVGLDVVVGYSGQLALGNFGFVAIGAYTSAVLAGRYGLSVWLTFPCAIAACAVVALVVGLPMVRLPQLGMALGTFFFAYIVSLLLAGQTLKRWTNSTDGIPVPALPALGADALTPYRLYYLTWLLLLVVVLLSVRYAVSRSGRMLRLIKHDEIVASVAGVDVNQAKLWAFVFSASVAGIAGVVFAQAIGFLAPETFPAIESVLLVAMAVVGGLGTIAGPILGAVAFNVLLELSRTAGSWREVMFASVLLAVLVFFKGGIVGLLELAAGWLHRQAPVQALGSRAVGLGRRLRGLPRPGPGAPPATVPPAVVGPRVVDQRGAARADPPDRAADQILSVRGVTVQFGGLRALDDVSLTVERGSVHAVIGPNGAGKTTLLNYISGVQRASAGTVTLDGRVLGDLAPHQVRRAGIARTFQHPSLAPDLTALENVQLGTLGQQRQSVWADLLPLRSTRARERAGRRDAWQALEQVGIAAARAQRCAGDLTPAEQKLVDIARAIVARPRVLLMDEPTAGLEEVDIEVVARILRQLNRDLGLSIAVIAHHVGFIREIADRATVLDLGRVLAHGTPEEVTSNTEVVDVFLGHEHV